MEELLSAVQSPGALDRVIPSPFGEVDGDTFARFVAFDGLIHGWDLAQATGQVWAPPIEVIAAVDAFAREAIAPAMRDGETFKEPAPDPPMPARSSTSWPSAAGPSDQSTTQHDTDHNTTTPHTERTCTSCAFPRNRFP